MLLLCALVLVLISSPLSVIAPAIQGRADPKYFDYFGYGLCGGWDFDLDCIPEVLVGDLRHGDILVISTVTGKALRSYESVFVGGVALQVVADSTGDSSPELIVTTENLVQGPKGGEVYCVSGADGSIVWGVPGNVCSVIGDFDQDGHTDLLVGHKSIGSRIVSGRLGTELLFVSSKRAYDVGDSDEDGLHEIAEVGAHSIVINPLVGGPTQRVMEVPKEYSRRFLEHCWRSIASRSIACPQVLNVGDWDEDGIAEIALRLRMFSDEPCLLTVFHGATGVPVLRISGGGKAFRAGDLDEDGIHEIGFTGSFVATSDRVRVHSGEDGRVLHAFGPDLPSSTSIEHTAISVPDIDGDDVDDIVVGEFPEPYCGLRGAGSIRLFSGKTGEMIRKITRADALSGY